MSKSLEKDMADLVRCEADLLRKAESQVSVIRRAVEEYAEAAETTSSGDGNLLLQKQRDIERAIGEHTQLYKAIRRVRKQIQAGIRPSNAKAS